MKTHPFRTDISNALIHLTGKRGTVLAKEALLSILSDGWIRGSGNSGFVKGKQTATCFTEMPLSSLPAFVNYSTGTSHPYEYYGIALSKHHAWERGARPVIYLPDNEASWIPEDHKWRHVRLDYGGKTDFTHEREWRSEGNFSLVEIGFYVIVPDRAQEDDARQILKKEADRHILGFLHMDTLSEFL